MNEIIWRDVLTHPPELETSDVSYCDTMSKELLFLIDGETFHLARMYSKNGIQWIEGEDEYEMYIENYNLQWLDIDFLKQFNKQ